MRTKAIHYAPYVYLCCLNEWNEHQLADYCGTSVVMIEKHYGKYIRNATQTSN
jgi:hypothetical protein